MSARVDVKPSRPDYDEAALDEANANWSKAWKQFRQHPSEGVADLNYKVEIIRLHFRKDRPTAWAQWADYGGDDWLGRDIARLAEADA